MEPSTQQQDDEAFFARVQPVMQELLERHGEEALARVMACFEGVLGVREPDYQHPLQRPGYAYFPGIAPRPWYQPREYPQLAEITRTLEAAFPRIQAEAIQLLTRGKDRAWVPYITNEREREKFRGLNEQMWTSVLLRKSGDWVAENCDRCPESVAALRAIETYLMAGGEAFFSLLKPGVSLPEHHDEANWKLTVHLPLVVPPDCAIRVGGETRSWREGECLVFDDTFLHSAWNHSEQPRICLLLDVWHPELQPVEIEALSALIAAAYAG